jgi:hypothetical protein
MNDDQRMELLRIAAELCGLHEAARAAGEPFVAYLIDMARIEAERLSLPQDASCAGADGPFLLPAEQYG